MIYPVLGEFKRVKKALSIIGSSVDLLLKHAEKLSISGLTAIVVVIDMTRCLKTQTI